MCHQILCNFCIIYPLQKLLNVPFKQRSQNYSFTSCKNNLGGICRSVSFQGAWWSLNKRSRLLFSRDLLKFIRYKNYLIKLSRLSKNNIVVTHIEKRPTS